MAALKPHGYWKEWTSGMYPVLYEIGAEAGFYVHCKPFEYNGKRVGDRELQYVDFMYFPNRPDPDQYIYYQLAVVIEHENNWDYFSKREDFWKVCLFVARLRIFLGYCGNKAAAEMQAKQLTEFYHQHAMTQLPEGETLIQISWDEASGQDWIAWLLRGQEPGWELVSG
jgi:hypothetical protein